LYLNVCSHTFKDKETVMWRIRNAQCTRNTGYIRDSRNVVACVLVDLPCTSKVNVESQVIKPLAVGLLDWKLLSPAHVTIRFSNPASASRMSYFWLNPRPAIQPQ